MNASTDSTAALSVFAAVFGALYAAHMVGDHWVQTDHQATTKGGPGWVARWADTRHVATLTACKVTALLALCLVTGAHLSPVRLLAGFGVDAVSHWWADRRTTLAHLADLTGNHGFYTLGAPRHGRDDNPSLGTGAYALDQSWHIGWLFATALIITA